MEHIRVFVSISIAWGTVIGGSRAPENVWRLFLDWRTGLSFMPDIMIRLFLLVLRSTTFLGRLVARCSTTPCIPKF